MGRRTCATAAGATAVLALAFPLLQPAAAVWALTTTAVGIDDTGIPPKCPGADSYCFVPTSVTLAAGGTVTWTSHSGTAHTVTADSTSPEQFDSGNVTQGYTFQHTFHSPGTFTYHCNYHSFMQATVRVTSAASSSSSSTAHTPTTPHTTTPATTTTSSTSAHPA